MNDFLKISIVDWLDIENHANLISNGDMLRNINSYEYLSNIARQIPEVWPNHNNDCLAELKKFFQRYPNYIEQYAYGDMYTNFLLNLESTLTSIQEKLTLRVLDNIIEAIYSNPNQALERAAKMIEEDISDVMDTSGHIEVVIRNRLNGISRKKRIERFESIPKQINKTTPQAQGSLWGRFKSLTAKNFKPSTLTSMSTIRHYDFHRTLPNHPIEHRFGTQGEYHNGKARINPLFTAWLKTQKRKFSNDAITHVYINNLGLDRSFSFEGKREKRLTNQLHALEKQHNNIAVITLPADEGFLNRYIYKQHSRVLNAKEAFASMLAVASGEKKYFIRDFYVSADVKKKLYGESLNGNGWDKESEKNKLNELLNKSFNALNISQEETNKISEAQFQAVYFHFIKYEFTNFILEKLQPKTFNISCKDGIDRAGAASAYYNLMKSLETNKQLTESEWRRALHAGATIVKGRGMNHHSKVLWNAVDAYVTAKTKNKEAIPKWLETWRDNNIPRHTKAYYINKLRAYKASREKGDDYHTFFARLDAEARLKATKIEAAEKLIEFLEGKSDAPSFEKKHRDAVKNGRLSDLVEGLLFDELITKVQVNHIAQPKQKNEGPYVSGPIHIRKR